MKDEKPLTRGQRLLLLVMKKRRDEELNRDPQYVANTKFVDSINELNP